MTLGFEVPPSDALNCMDWLGLSEAVVGEIVIETLGSKVTTAVATFVGSAALVAATVTFCCAETLAGAV